MKRWQRHTCVVTSKRKRDAAHDASSAREIYIDKSQGCGKRLYCRWIRNSHRKFFARDVVRGDSSRPVKTVCADSES